MLALLAMMKTVADKFDYASVELFKKLKLYFVQASGKQMHSVKEEKRRKLIFEYRRVSSLVVNSVC
jgi:hypothetical protein